jgi:D-arabinose 5-phosphate isomerase GutQ
MTDCVECKDVVITGAGSGAAGRTFAVSLAG